MASSVRDQIEQEEPFSEAPPSGVEFAVPRWLRLLMFFVFLAVFIGALGLLAGYLALEKQSWEPARLDIVKIIFFSLLGVTVCLLPWEQFTMKIKKIGPIEFEQVLSTQAREHAVELHELHERIEAVAEAQQRPSGKSGNLAGLPSLSRNQMEELERILKRFFSSYAYAFSPSRIVVWGSQQPGFQQLAQHQVQDIRRALQAMVAEGALETTVSTRGNTLYRLPQSHGLVG